MMENSHTDLGDDDIAILNARGLRVAVGNDGETVVIDEYGHPVSPAHVSQILLWSRRRDEDSEVAKLIRLHRALGAQSSLRPWS